jgi:hypothetical protein
VTRKPDEGGRIICLVVGSHLADPMGSTVAPALALKTSRWTRSSEAVAVVCMSRVSPRTRQRALTALLRLGH